MYQHLLYLLLLTILLLRIPFEAKGQYKQITQKQKAKPETIYLYNATGKLLAEHINDDIPFRKNQRYQPFSDGNKIGLIDCLEGAIVQTPFIDDLYESWYRGKPYHCCRPNPEDCYIMLWGVSWQKLNIFEVEGKKGIITLEGKIVLPATHENETIHIIFGQALIKGKDGWGLIDQKGQLLLPTKYERIQLANSSWAKVVEQGDTSILHLQADGQDQSINRATFESLEKENRRKTVHPFFTPDFNRLNLKHNIPEGFNITTDKDGVYVGLSINETQILANQYQSVYPFTTDLIVLQEKDQFGLFRLSDKTWVAPLEFHEFEVVSDELLLLYKRAKI